MKRKSGSELRYRFAREGSIWLQFERTTALMLYLDCRGHFSDEV
jgi:hypothetical protein